MKIRINNLLVYRTMIEAGIGIGKLCALSGAGTTTLHKVLEGKMVYISSLKRIADALEIPAREMVITEDAPPEIKKESPRDTPLRKKKTA